MVWTPSSVLWMRVRSLSCPDKKRRCSEASEAQIYLHLFLGGNMPEIAKGHPVSNAWFDENSGESKVIADRETLIFWWRQIYFFPRVHNQIFAPCPWGLAFSSCSYCGALSSFPDCTVLPDTWGKCHFSWQPAGYLWVFLLQAGPLFLSGVSSRLQAPCSLSLPFLQWLSPAPCAAASCLLAWQSEAACLSAVLL